MLPFNAFKVTEAALAALALLKSSVVVPSLVITRFWIFVNVGLTLEPAIKSVFRVFV